MSANILWEPATRPCESLDTLAPQNFMRSLEVIGWSNGNNLNETHLSALRGMSAVYRGGQTDVKNPYQQLIDAIERHKEIRVWAEY